MAEFFSIITSTGLAKLASLPVGNTLTLTHMAFGNSTLTPYEDQTALNSEQYRCALTKVANIDNEPDCIVAEAIITAEHGGFWIREVGILIVMVICSLLENIQLLINQLAKRELSKNLVFV